MEQLKVERTFSRGIALAEAFVYEKQELQAAREILQDEVQIQENIDRFNTAVLEVSKDLEKLAENSEIFEGHLTIANDIALKETVLSKIIEEKQNVELAVENTIEDFSAMMTAIDDPYMQERAVDIKDVGDRFMAALQGSKQNDLAGIKREVIIIAEDLTPSDTALMNFDFVKGFITEKGGVTSHVSIIARSLGLPALVGASGILGKVRSGDEILFDAATGEIYINPEDSLKQDFLKKADLETKFQNEIMQKATLPVETKDGRKIKVYANVGSSEEVKQAMHYKINGIGLFRSEFLFMNNTQFPTEEEQFHAYKEAVETLGHELIIRTLDIGGDKELPYYEFAKEDNPFLGWRAIRMCFDEQEVFQTQIRALLRASAFGPIKIMIPMIISVEECLKVKEIVNKCKAELKQAGIAYNQDVPLGIMVETAAAVMLAPDLAKVVDFFSIGTNDLTQYILSVDRGNKKIEHLYNSFHPAVLRAIYQVIKAANDAGIEVGMCGEFAAEQKITEILLGFGLDEYSMAAGETPIIKDLIRNLSYEEAREKARQVLSCSTIEEVFEIVEQ